MLLMDSVIDIGPLMDDVILPIAGAALTALFGIATAYIWKKLGLAKDDASRAILEQFFQSAASSLVQKAAAMGLPYEKIHTNNALLAEGANFVLQGADKSLKQLDIPQTIKAVGDRIVARIPEQAAKMAVAKGTAPVEIVQTINKAKPGGK